MALSDDLKTIADEDVLYLGWTLTTPNKLVSCRVVASR